MRTPALNRAGSPKSVGTGASEGVENAWRVSEGSRLITSTRAVWKWWHRTAPRGTCGSIDLNEGVSQPQFPQAKSRSRRLL
jgi:hypothetical protein